MKKFFSVLFVALSLSIAANAGCIVGFSSKSSSLEFGINGNSIYSKCNSNGGYSGDIIAHAQKNPFYNSQMCAPDKAWCSCFEYCFSYAGKTFYFNK